MGLGWPPGPMEGLHVKTTTRKVARRTVTQIVVKRTASSGRILYDVDSILSSDAAKRHFEALERMLAAGRIEKRDTSTANEH